MGGLSELYQNVILEHNRSPRNYRALSDADRKAQGSNPLCGDEVVVWLRMDGDVIREATFQGGGCAISKASASLMTCAVVGKTPRGGRGALRKVPAAGHGETRHGRGVKLLGSLPCSRECRNFRFE